MTIIGTFAHNAASGKFVSLGKDDVPAFLELHNQLIASGYPLKERSQDDLVAHLRAGHKIIAVRLNDLQIAAQLLLTLPNHGATRHLEGYPFGRDIPQHQCAMIQALGLHPDFIGKKTGLPKGILHAAQLGAESAGCSHLLASMKAGRKDVLGSFKSAGFVELGAPVTVGNNDYVSQFLHKAIQPKALTAAA